MASSGIEVSVDIESEFNKMKMDKEYQLMVMSIDRSGAKEIIVLDEVRKQCTYDDVLEFFKSRKSDCCYCVHEFKDNEIDKTGHLLFISWVPDESKVGDRMIYASSKSTLMLKLSGTKFKIDCNDLEDANFNEVKKNRKRF